MIKSKFHFVLGIFCVICLLAHIIMGPNPFVTIVTLIGIFLNFVAAFTE